MITLYLLKRREINIEVLDERAGNIQKNPNQGNITRKEDPKEMEQSCIDNMSIPQIMKIYEKIMIGNISDKDSRKKLLNEVYQAFENSGMMNPETLYSLQEAELIKIYRCFQNEWTWCEMLGVKPEGWDSMPKYRKNSMDAELHVRDEYLRPYADIIRMIVKPEKLRQNTAL